MDVHELEKLNELKEKGVLTDEEFQKAKENLLNGGSTAIVESASGLKCPKCNSKKVNIQIVDSGSVGTSKTKIKGEKKHGCIYWLLLGWIDVLISIFTWPFKLLFGSRKKSGTATTITGNKNINVKTAICQNCGHSWKIK